MNYKKVKFRLGLEDCELVTRKGEKVTYGGHNPDAITRHKIIGWVGNVAMHWDENGNFSKEESDYDLFALCETQTGFINIHKDSMGFWADERIYDYYSIAEENGHLSETYFNTLEIDLT